MPFTICPSRRFRAQCFLVAMVLALTGLDLGMVHAQSSIGRGSLRGLPGVAVVMTEIRPDAQTDGLSREAVLAAVELIRRSSGIRILAQSESSANPSDAALFVMIETMKDLTSTLYPYDVSRELIHKVAAVPRQHTVLARTWNTPAYIGAISAMQMNELITKVEKQVTVFASDFLAVNPR